MMKNILVCSAALAFLPGTLHGQITPADGVRRMSAAEVQSAVAVKLNGLKTAPLPVPPSINAIVAGRDRSGQVEIHDRLADVLICQIGEGTVHVGGVASGQTATAPGEWRGGAIAGGRDVAFRPGDVVWVPAGVPHQMILKSGGKLTYFALKYPISPVAVLSNQRGKG